MRIRVNHLLLLLSTTAFASAGTIPVISDGNVHSKGANGISLVTDAASIHTSRSGGSNVRHGLFEFDLSMLELSDQATIESASVQFELVAPISNTSTSAEVAFYGYTSDAVLDVNDFDTPAATSDWLLQSEIFPARAGNSPPTGTTLTIDFDNLQPLQDAISAGQSHFTIRSETVNFVSFQVGSLEHATATPTNLQVSIMPVLGDLDRNGIVDIRDIDHLEYGNVEHDLNADAIADERDFDFLVKDLIGTWYGDADGDGRFSSEDLVAVFVAGKFESGEYAGWGEGDWNHDGIFDSTDFVAAFVDGGFERQQAVASVPEPAGLTLLLLGLFGLGCCSRRR